MSITQLQNNIADAKEKIAKYSAIISSISDINGKLDLCSTTLNKTSDLIGQALVIDGQTGDNGKTAEIAVQVSNCANNFSGVSSIAQSEISKLNNDIINWQNEIARIKEQERAREREKEKERIALLGVKKP